MYKSRKIKFKEIISVDQWSIKAYVISEKEDFNSFDTYDSAIQNLPEWLGHLNSFDSSHENMSFLIIHEGNEEVFTLLNTWVGNNMLQTHIFLSKHDRMDHFTKISGDGLFACVWELEVINHERKSWMTNILKNPENPDYESYLQDIINIRV